MRLPLTVLSLAVASLLTLTPTAQAADFNDSDYHEVVLFEWDESTIDVLIIPPTSSHTLWRVDAVEQGIDAWEAGIDAAGDWLSGVDINRYTLGTDAPALPGAGVLTDPEVIVYSQDGGVLGIGIPLDFIVCDFVDQFFMTPETLSDMIKDAHHHANSIWSVLQIQPCRDSTENVCLVINTSWNTVQNFMYDLNAHEFGHCLGIGHVGDAGDFSAQSYPASDIMSYQNDPDEVHCVSTLNKLALKVAFADILGETPPTTEIPAFDGFLRYVEQTQGAYSNASCSNPPVAPLDIDWLPFLE